MLMGCGCGGVMEVFFLMLMGGTSVGTFLGALRLKIKRR